MRSGDEDKGGGGICGGRVEGGTVWAESASQPQAGAPTYRFEIRCITLLYCRGRVIVFTLLKS